MLVKVKNSSSRNLTWETICECLRDPTVGHASLADDLEAKYSKQDVQTVKEGKCVHTLESGYLAKHSVVTSLLVVKESMHKSMSICMGYWAQWVHVPPTPGLPQPSRLAYVCLFL